MLGVFSLFICRCVLLTDKNQKSTACFGGYKKKYFVYIFKIKAELFTTSNILLRFGSVNVFNSQYKKCYLYADCVYFGIIYKAILCDGSHVCKVMFSFVSPFLWCGAHYRYINVI